MPQGQLVVLDPRLHLRLERQEPHGVGDRRALLAELLGDRLLREPELLDEALVGPRSLHRIEILALEVFDQRHLHRLGIRGQANDGRNFFQARHFGRAPAALTSDHLVAAVPQSPDQDRLQHAFRLDRVGQLFELGRVDGAARLEGVR